jgi:large conductance mechanosensitive channel
MTGFKDFILRGNLVELAVALIMALAFTAVVMATVDLIMSLLGKLGGQPDFSGWRPGDVPVGAWITAVVGFLIIAAVVYFLIVKPYTAAKERYVASQDQGTPTDVALLQEIRDLLAGGAGRTP